MERYFENESFDHLIILKTYFKFAYYLCCSPFQLIEEPEPRIGGKYKLRRNLLQNVIKQAIN